LNAGEVQSSLSEHEQRKPFERKAAKTPRCKRFYELILLGFFAALRSKDFYFLVNEKKSV